MTGKAITKSQFSQAVKSQLTPELYDSFEKKNALVLIYDNAVEVHTVESTQVFRICNYANLNELALDIARFVL